MVLAAQAGGEGADGDEEQRPQHDHTAHKADALGQIAEHEVVLGVDDRIVVVGEKAPPEDLPRADGRHAAQLLAGDVRVLVGIEQGHDAVYLIALERVGEKADDEGKPRDPQGDGREDVFPGEPRREEHHAADGAEDDGGAVVALDVHHRHGGQDVGQQLCQRFWLVDVLAHIVQMHGEGEDEADLCKLGGLQAQGAKADPAVVVGAFGVPAEGQRADAQMGEGEQHQRPGAHHVHRPDAGQTAVVDAGEHDGAHKAQQAGHPLHKGVAVAAQAGDGAVEGVPGEAPRRLPQADQSDDAEHRAEHTGGDVGPVGGLEVLSDDLEHHPHPLSKVGHCFIISHRAASGNDFPRAAFCSGRANML